MPARSAAKESKRPWKKKIDATPSLFKSSGWSAPPLAPGSGTSQASRVAASMPTMNQSRGRLVTARGLERGLAEGRSGAGINLARPDARGAAALSGRCRSACQDFDELVQVFTPAVEGFAGNALVFAVGAHVEDVVLETRVSVGGDAGVAQEAAVGGA